MSGSGWQKCPFKISVTKGQKLAFCSCNQSQKPPFCDGTHFLLKLEKGPYILEFEKDETLSVCGCQNSKHRPFCDGSHKEYLIKDIDCGK